jgi:succinate dehydrogenase / fumarate reductase cytochrome b subunit
MTQDTRDALMIGRSSDGKLVRRPLSPHLQIYRPQITSMLSISHRATGVALSVGSLVLTWWLVAAATSDAAFATVSSVINSPIGLILLFGWTASLWYHFCNGIRHLAWDAGYGFSLPSTHRSGWAVLIASAALTLGTWVVVVAVL